MPSAVFLQAAVPLTKTFELNNGELKKIGHPRVIDYTSHVVDYTTIEQLLLAVTHHAKQNHCFLKGQLSRPLVNESRAGSTDPHTLTEILLLDLDGLKGINTVEQFMQLVGLADVDHIIQYSASMGVVPERGLSAHIFVLLEKPAAPSQLKQWLQHLNMSIPALRNNIQLTRTHNALRWPLDISTCQNDKLIYIAPPLLGKGVTDTFKEKRIELVARSRRAASLPTSLPSAEKLRLEQMAVLNHLRTVQGLAPRKDTKMKAVEGIEYMPKPDQAIVTDLRRERGFVYLNLNGGDSWGYYHPENNPKFILNFKGEPTYLTSELLPDYYAQALRESNKAKQEGKFVDERGTLLLAFRDFRTGQYWNGYWVESQQRLELAPAKSEKQLKDFLKQHGSELGDFVPDWNLIFDPSSEITVDVDAKTINQYVPTDFMRVPAKRVKDVPSTIAKVIDHALGHDGDAVAHFLNWLAVIAQFKKRTLTSWVLHGTQGTGKGILLNHVLRPLFGDRYVSSIRQEQLEHQFNGFLENRFILFVDEAQLSASDRSATLEANLKNYIVEPTLTIRHMHQAAYSADNYLNVIFASNKDDPVIIPPEDRRFNVAAYQPQRLVLSDAEIEQLELELMDFAHYLRTRTADRDLARTPLNNSAREKVIHISRSAIDIACGAILAGDISFFADQLPSGNLDTLPNFQQQRALAYQSLVEHILKNAPESLSRDDARVLLDYTIGGMPESPYKFTSYVKHHGLTFSPVWDAAAKKTVRGLPVKWKLPEERKA